MSLGIEVHRLKIREAHFHGTCAVGIRAGDHGLEAEGLHVDNGLLTCLVLGPITKDHRVIAPVSIL